MRKASSHPRAPIYPGRRCVATIFISVRSRVSVAPSAFCLRFAGWVAPPPRKTRFWLLVQLCQAGFIPAGFQRKVSEFKSLPPSQSLPDARTPYLLRKSGSHSGGSSVWGSVAHPPPDGVGELLQAVDNPLVRPVFAGLAGRLHDFAVMSFHGFLVELVQRLGVLGQKCLADDGQGPGGSAKDLARLISLGRNHVDGGHGGIDHGQCTAGSAEGCVDALADRCLGRRVDIAGDGLQARPRSEERREG